MVINKLRRVISVTPTTAGGDARAERFSRFFRERGIRSDLYCFEEPVRLSEVRGRQDSGPRRQKSRRIDGLIPRVLRSRSASFKDGIKQNRVLSFGVFLVWILWILMRNAKLLFYLLSGPKAELIILHECSRFPAVWVCLSVRGGTLLYDAHDFYSEIESRETASAFQRLWLFPTLARIERSLLTRADGFTVVSEGLAQLYTARYGRCASVVRNAHDASVDGEIKQNSDFRSELGLGHGDFAMAVIGNHKPGQNFEGLLQHLGSGAQDVHIVLFGGGYEPVVRRANDLGVASNVHNIGFQSPETLVGMAAQLDAAAILYEARSENYRNALPNGFFQGIAAGLPVLYLPLPEIDALARKHKIGLCVEAGIQSAWSRTINQIRTEAGLATDLRKAVASCRDELSWTGEKQRFEGVLRSLPDLPR